MDIDHALKQISVLFFLSIKIHDPAYIFSYTVGGMVGLRVIRVVVREHMNRDVHKVYSLQLSILYIQSRGGGGEICLLLID